MLGELVCWCRDPRRVYILIVRRHFSLPDSRTAYGKNGHWKPLSQDDEIRSSSPINSTEFARSEHPTEASLFTDD